MAWGSQGQFRNRMKQHKLNPEPLPTTDLVWTPACVPRPSWPEPNRKEHLRRLASSSSVTGRCFCTNSRICCFESKPVQGSFAPKSKSELTDVLSTTVGTLPERKRFLRWSSQPRSLDHRSQSFLKFKKCSGSKAQSRDYAEPRHTPGPIFDRTCT